MILFQFRNADVSETAFAQDRDDLAALLVEQYGANLATLAAEYDLSEAEYLAAWRAMDPSETLRVRHERGNDADERTVAEWVATEGKRGLLTTSPFVGQTMQASSTEKPTMATFVRMAEHAPLDLVARVRAGGMSPGLLARAAEAMGKIHDHDTAVPELLILLKNEDIAVQEGAIYGLSQHLTDDVRRTLQGLSSDESAHSLIREIAADSLES